MAPVSCSRGSGRISVVVAVDDWVKCAQNEERMAFKMPKQISYWKPGVYAKLTRIR